MWKVTARNINMFLLIIMDKLFDSSAISSTKLDIRSPSQFPVFLLLPVQCQRFARSTLNCWARGDSGMSSSSSKSSSCSSVRGKPVVLKHFISVDGAVSDHAFAIQLIASSKAISLQSSETLSALSILLKSDRSWCFLYRALKARIIPRSRLKTRNLIWAASLKLSRSV